jgi:hypothetical protein
MLDKMKEIGAVHLIEYLFGKRKCNYIAIAAVIFTNDFTN